MSEDEDAFYQWVDCNDDFTPIDGATMQSFTPEENGDYAVILSEGFCEQMTACFTISTVSIEEHKSVGQFNIYPNPIETRFFIDLGEVYNNGAVLISNITGQIVQTEIFTNQSLIDIDLNQEAGIYFVRIAADKEVVTMRIVKN